jgi:hypothetical protein
VPGLNGTMRHPDAFSFGSISRLRVSHSELFSDGFTYAKVSPRNSKTYHILRRLRRECRQPEGYSCRMPSKSNRRKRRARGRGLRRALLEKAAEAHERPTRIDEPKTILVPDDGLDRLFVPREK